MNNMDYYMADTESDTPKVKQVNGINTVEHLERVNVWAVGLLKLYTEKIFFFNSLKNFFNEIDKFEKNSIIFFHNLSWDGIFLLEYFKDNNFIFNDPEEKTKDPSKVDYIIDLNNKIFEISFYNKKRKLIRFRDSLKLIPLPVKKIGEIFGGVQKIDNFNYSETRGDGHKLTEEEKKYISADIKIVAKALESFENRFKGYISNITLSNYSFSFFLNQFNGRGKTLFNSFKKIFPDVDDPFYRNAYRGGWCYVNKDIQGEELRGINGHTYDVNSLYPFVMSNHEYPCGSEYIWGGGLDEILKTNLIFFIEFEASFRLKKNGLPFIQKKGAFFRESSHIVYSDGIEYLTLSRPDFENFIKFYDYDFIQIHEIRYFKKTCKPFNNYIDHWFKIKEEGQIKGDNILRTFAKLMLNSLYGKFAQSPKRISKKIKIKNNSLNFEKFESTARAYYIPIGALITAYARSITLNAARKNINIFLYSDTDSLHLKDKAIGIEIDNIKLGAWDLEKKFSDAKFLRQKCYIEKTEGDKYELKCAGLPDPVKKNFLRESTDPIKDFIIGLELWGKLMRKKTRGGVYLYPSTFKIKG